MCINVVNYQSNIQDKHLAKDSELHLLEGLVS